MHSAQVIVTVKQLEPSLREQGIRAIYLFGSVARETQTDSSDIDLAFDLAPGATERFSLIDQLHIQRQLAAALGTNVDLIERDYLRPRVCIIIRPAEVVVSIASVRERKPAPVASIFSRMWMRSFRDRESRSSFQVTTTSPGRRWSIMRSS